VEKKKADLKRRGEGEKAKKENTPTKIVYSKKRGEGPGGGKEKLQVTPLMGPKRGPRRQKGSDRKKTEKDKRLSYTYLVGMGHLRAWGPVGVTTENQINAVALAQRRIADRDGNQRRSTGTMAKTWQTVYKRVPEEGGAQPTKIGKKKSKQRHGDREPLLRTNKHS